MDIQRAFFIPVRIVSETVDSRATECFIFGEPSLRPIELGITRFRPCASGTSSQAVHEDNVGDSIFCRAEEGVQSEWPFDIPCSTRTIGATSHETFTEERARRGRVSPDSQVQLPFHCLWSMGVSGRGPSGIRQALVESQCLEVPSVAQTKA